ncbi:7-alpha-hydroxysteroid dehydrogenase [Litoreibacter ponti]|uniref:7-alpha-hydroxysteroid dehydrogenase n=1 Tax=Litoreibacter ponti TaxID=1510457 RepID=A0A2T6BFQ5_9RHOB|nr:SDR family oxidoreductase [Litoreibacter ponti]PTX54886.1 7-alpha-hydroxysteroid dehydrogenase [Litoreibacter ponti]
MSFSIAGKTAIITGAANGVGLAVARQFITMGANVMMADRDEERLRAEVDDASDEEGNARIFACDLREKLSQANLLSATLDAFDRVDILVNGSRQVMSTDPLDTEDDTIEQMLAQNLMSGLRLSQLVAKRMIKQAEDDESDDNKGSIVNLSSIAARRTRPGLMGYSIASAALDQMTRTMAIALAPERIRVNAVAFGSVMSSSLKYALKETDGLRDDIIEHTPLSRIASASEVADAVQFLCSPGAGFITGEIITVDGGRALLDPVETAAH